VGVCVASQGACTASAQGAIDAYVVVVCLYLCVCVPMSAAPGRGYRS
jgi:hypothetical protein